MGSSSSTTAPPTTSAVAVEKTTEEKEADAAVAAIKAELEAAKLRCAEWKERAEDCSVHEFVRAEGQMQLESYQELIKQGEKLTETIEKLKERRMEIIELLSQDKYDKVLKLGLDSCNNLLETKKLIKKFKTMIALRSAALRKLIEARDGRRTLSASEKVTYYRRVFHPEQDEKGMLKIQKEWDRIKKGAEDLQKHIESAIKEKKKKEGPSWMWSALMVARGIVETVIVVACCVTGVGVLGVGVGLGLCYFSTWLGTTLASVSVAAVCTGASAALLSNLVLSLLNAALGYKMLVNEKRKAWAMKALEKTAEYVKETIDCFKEVASRMHGLIKVLIDTFNAVDDEEYDLEGVPEDRFEGICDLDKMKKAFDELYEHTTQMSRKITGIVFR